MTESIKSYLDNGEFVAGIFIDLEKAFDTVNHEILCEKLSYYGFRGKINQLLTVIVRHNGCTGNRFFGILVLSVNKS